MTDWDNFKRDRKPSRRWTDEESRTAARMASEGASSKEIAAELGNGRTSTMVNAHLGQLRKAGWPIPERRRGLAVGAVMPKTIDRGRRVATLRKLNLSFAQIGEILGFSARVAAHCHEAYMSMGRQKSDENG